MLRLTSASAVILAALATPFASAQTFPTTTATTAPTTQGPAAEIALRWMVAAQRRDAAAARALMLVPAVTSRKSGGPMFVYMTLARIRAGDYVGRNDGAPPRVLDVIDRGDCAIVRLDLTLANGGPVPFAAAMVRTAGDWRYLDALAGFEGAGLSPEQQVRLREAFRESSRTMDRLQRPLLPESRAKLAAKREQDMALGRAVHANDPAGARAAIAAGATAEIDAVAEQLGLAIANDWRDVARALIDGGARVHPHWFRYWLDEHSDRNAAVRSLEFGLDPNEPEMSGDGMRTALMHAVEAGDVELTRLMLARGGRFEDTGELATTYLNAAAASGVATMVDLVLAAQPDVLAVSQFGETPLHEVAFGPVANLIEPARREVGHDRASIVAALLKLGVDPHAHVRFPRRPGIDTALSIAADRWRGEVVEALLPAGGYSADELTDALARVAPQCDVATVAALVRSGARVADARVTDVQDGDGRGANGDALHRAILGRCDASVAAALLDAGAAIESTDGPLRRTPLQQSIASGNAAMVRALLDRGASCAAKDARGQDAQSLAATRVARGREHLLGDHRQPHYQEEFDADGFVPADVAEIARLLGVPTAARPATRP